MERLNSNQAAEGETTSSYVYTGGVLTDVNNSVKAYILKTAAGIAFTMKKGCDDMEYHAFMSSFSL